MFLISFSLQPGINAQFQTAFFLLSVLYDIIDIPNMVASDAETPPTCFLNLLFVRGGQSEEKEGGLSAQGFQTGVSAVVHPKSRLLTNLMFLYLFSVSGQNVSTIIT